MNALQRYFVALTVSLVLLVTVFWSYSHNRIKVIGFLDFRLLENRNFPIISGKMEDVFIHLEKNYVNIFLVEPRFLTPTIKNEERLLLEKRHPNATDFQESKYITTVGVLEESNALQKNSSLMLNVCTKFFAIVGYDPRLLHWDPSKSKNSEIHTHYFCINDDKILHIVVFIHRNNYFWVGQVNAFPEELSNLISKDELFLGKTAAGFEKFELKLTSYGNSSIRIPSDPLLFLSELPYSRFLECNSEEVIKFHSLHPESAVINKEFDAKLISAIRNLKTYLRPILAPFWICSGSLLGWYRQCGNIPYTTDIDFAMWSWDMDPDITENIKKAKSDLKLKIIYGKLEKCFQYAFYLNKERVDLFFVYRNKTNFFDCGHIPSAFKFFRYIFPQYTLCSADMLGEKVFLPCDPEKIIYAEYGDKWREPVKGWDYASSSFNIEHFETWPADQHKYAAQYV